MSAYETSPGLSRAEIVRLLDPVAVEAHRQDLNVSLFLVGGAAMTLAYSTSRATRDLDVDSTVFSDVPGLAVRVASPRYLFVMKSMAARESELDDSDPVSPVWP